MSVDQSLFLFLNSLHATWLNPIAQILSSQAVWIPFIGYFLWYAYRYQGIKFLFMFTLFLLLSLVASDVSSSYLMKNIFSRLRPCREIDLKPLINMFGQKCGGKYGFVSSHAANSFNLIFFSIRALKFGNKKYHYLWLVPVLVSYSRIYLGVHYPGDIVGGMIIGLVFGYIFSTLMSLRSKSESFPA